MLGHGDGQQRQRERDTDPEAPRHVAQFRIFGFACRWRHRLESHPADRAIARLLAQDLRMHRAGPQDLTGWDAYEATAVSGQEDIAVAGIISAMLGIGGIDTHSAYGIAFRTQRVMMLGG